MIKITPIKKNEYLKVMKIEKNIFGKKVFINQLKNYLNEGSIKIWRISTTKIIGFIIFYHIIDEIDIIRIGITKSHQRKNYGTLIINKIKKLNVKRIFIEVSVENSQAINFYIKNGFKKIGIRKDYYRWNNNKIDALRLLFEF